MQFANKFPNASYLLHRIFTTGLLIAPLAACVQLDDAESVDEAELTAKVAALA